MTVSHNAAYDCIKRKLDNEVKAGKIKITNETVYRTNDWHLKPDCYLLNEPYKISRGFSEQLKETFLIPETDYNFCWWPTQRVTNAYMQLKSKRRVALSNFVEWWRQIEVTVMKELEDMEEETTDKHKFLILGWDMKSQRKDLMLDIYADGQIHVHMYESRRKPLQHYNKFVFSSTSLVLPLRGWMALIDHIRENWPLPAPKSGGLFLGCSDKKPPAPQGGVGGLVTQGFSTPVSHGDCRRGFGSFKTPVSKPAMGFSFGSIVSTANTNATGATGEEGNPIPVITSVDRMKRKLLLEGKKDGDEDAKRSHVELF